MTAPDYNVTRAERGWPLMAASGTRTRVKANGFSREVRFEPGHPLTPGTGPSSNYGRGSLKIRFLLHGRAASVQFLWSTGVTPERVTERDRWGARHEWMHSAPMAYDLGYHAEAPQWEGHEGYACDMRSSGTCYYDGSSFASDRVLELFLTKGEDAMWDALHGYYEEHFGAAS